MYVSVKGVRGRGGESLKGELSLSMTLQKRSQHCTAQSPPPTLKLRVNGVCPLFIRPPVCRSARLAKSYGQVDLAWRVIYYRHSKYGQAPGEGSQTNAELSVLLLNVGPINSRKLSEICLKTIRKLSVSKICQRTVRKLSDMCQKTVISRIL